MTPEELEILEALEGVARDSTAYPAETIHTLLHEGYIKSVMPYGQQLISLTRAGREVLALRREVARLEYESEGIYMDAAGESI